MNKETFRDVCISCFIFLLLVFGASLWIQKFQSLQNQAYPVSAGYVVSEK